MSLPQAASASQLPTLEALSERAAAAAVSPGDVCGALALAEALAPAAGCLRAAGLRLLAERLPAVLAADAAGFAALPAAALEAVLQGQALVRSCCGHCMIKSICSICAAWGEVMPGPDASMAASG